MLLVILLMLLLLLLLLPSREALLCELNEVNDFVCMCVCVCVCVFCLTNITYSLFTFSNWIRVAFCIHFVYFDVSIRVVCMLREYLHKLRG